MLRSILYLSLSVLFVVGVITLTSIRDELIKPNRFDCRMLIGGWHPDVPVEIAEECKKRSIK